MFQLMLDPWVHGQHKLDVVGLYKEKDIKLEWRWNWSTDQGGLSRKEIKCCIINGFLQKSYQKVNEKISFETKKTPAEQSVVPN